MTTPALSPRPSTPAPRRDGRPEAHRTAERRRSGRARPLLDPPIVRRAIRDAFVKLDPRRMVRNPVMFVVLLGSAYATAVLVRDVATGRPGVGFTLQLALWLWFTVLFANFAEAMAEGRGKAQADALRKSRTQTAARRLAPGTVVGARPDAVRTEAVGA
jgi:K+-transporting ATPase ATPase B chain